MATARVSPVALAVGMLGSLQLAIERASRSTIVTIRLSLGPPLRLRPESRLAAMRRRPASYTGIRSEKLRTLRAAVRNHEDERRALATENLSLLHRARVAEDTIKTRDRVIAHLEMMVRQ